MGRYPKRKPCPIHNIEIPIKEDIFDHNGQIVKVDVQKTTFKTVIDQIRSMNIPESEWDNIIININDHPTDYPTLNFNYMKQKTQQELDDEQKEIDKEIALADTEKENRRKQKEKKKQKKLNALNSLTPEQKRALGI